MVTTQLLIPPVMDAMPSFLLLGLVAACDDQPSCTNLGEPSLVLGTGETSFIPLNEGDTLDPEFGAQGGYHIWISMMLEGIWPGSATNPGSNPIFHASLFRNDVGVGGLFGDPARLVEGQGPTYEMVGLQLRLSPLLTVAPPTDEGDYHVTAGIRDACGSDIEDTVGIDLILPPPF